jgi:hypothetical protein
MTCFSLLSLSEKNFYLYIIDYHMVEGAQKERHLKGQSVRAVIFNNYRVKTVHDKTKNASTCYI